MIKFKKRILKIGAFLLALSIIGVNLKLIDSYKGNPISRYIAEKKINTYIKDNYKEEDFEIGEVKYEGSYSYGYRAYSTYLKSKISMDKKFYIYYLNNGEIYTQYDYNNDLDKDNVWKRLSEEYSKLVEEFIFKELGYKNSTTISNDNNREVLSKLELDMELDKSLFSNQIIQITLYSDSESYEKVVEACKNINKSLIENGYIFGKYGLYSNGEFKLSIYDVEPKDFENGNLEKMIQENL